MTLSNRFRELCKKCLLSGKRKPRVCVPCPTCPGVVDVTQLASGERARVIELTAGGKMAARFEAMGIVPGATITKKSSSPMKGPVVIVKGLSQFALGYAMARRVIVERLSK